MATVYEKYLEPPIGINEESIGSSLRPAFSGCFLGVFVITNTSDVLGAGISDPCADRRW
jgi:hypothetical protein